MEECCICYKETKDEEFRKLNPCEHKLCKNCMKEYVTRMISTCPMCRERFNLGEHLAEFGNGSILNLVMNIPSIEIQPDRIEIVIGTISRRNVHINPSSNPLPDWRQTLMRNFQ